jgi:Uma2 family endonuclease
MSTALKKRLYTVSEYQQLGQLGFFKPGERLELIEGEVVLMSPISGAHARVLNKLVKLMSGWTDLEITLSIQNPLLLPKSLPQPDLVLLRSASDDKDDVPASHDALLVVEVCDTTYAADRDFKLPIYAGESIPEVWLLNLPERTIEVHSQPDPVEHVYTVCRKYEADKSEPLTFRGHSLVVADVMKPVMNAAT